MSIRSEEAVEQVSRFSLRACVVGTETRPPPQAPRPPPQAQPQSQQSKPKNGNFTFSSLVKTAPPAAVVTPARDPLATARALAAISAAQRSSTATAPVRAADARTLPIGFISGGTTQTASKAELLRLTATVDTLQSQLSHQAGRLQRTEASLVKANRDLTAQAAMANSRLVRLQTEIKEARASEEKLRAASASALLRTASPAPATPSFEETAKKAEAFDAKLLALNATIDGLRSERDDLNTSSAALKAKLDVSTTALADLQSRQNDTSELQLKLQEVTAEATASAAAALAAKDEAEATKARLAQFAASTTTSAAASGKLQARIDQLTAEVAEATACMHAEREVAEVVRAQVVEAADAAEAAAAEAAEAKAGTKRAEEALATVKLQQTTPKVVTQLAVPLQPHTLSYFYNTTSPSTPRVPTTTKTRQKRQTTSQSARPLIGASHAAKRTLFAKSTLAMFDEPRGCNLINNDCFSTASTQPNETTAAFVTAVSLDALEMCRGQRRRVLSAMGLTDEEIETDLSMFDAK